MTTTTTRRSRPGTVAPSRPRHQPAPPTVRRHLRPVPDVPARREQTATPSRRRLRPQVALTLALGAFFLILFGVALLQTVLVQGQIHLDGLRADVAQRESEAATLRATVAEGESPAEIIDAAEALGMVVPTHVEYIQQAPVEGGPATP